MNAINVLRVECRISNVQCQMSIRLNFFLFSDTCILWRCLNGLNGGGGGLVAHNLRTALPSDLFDAAENVNSLL